MTDMLAPVRLAPNQPPARPYRGGAGILALRGTGSTDDHAPEDFVASTTTTHGSDSVGLTTLDDGRTLREAVEADPVGYVGPDHVARFGADTALLVKILSTGERLFTHFHPGAEFAATHLGSPRGKTEAWLITDTGDTPTAPVWLGFRRAVSRPELAEWVERQDAAALLDALHPLEVAAGDSLYVPAGTPHSIGAGITLVELQEPSDLSIVLEYASFPALDPSGAMLGLEVATALEALDTTVLTSAEVEALHGTRGPGPRSRLLPTAADAYFRAELVAPAEGETVDQDPGFSVLVVLDGRGSLDRPGGSLPLVRGDVLLVPFGAGPWSLAGGLQAIVCRPPAPDAPVPAPGATEAGA
jgi:mannose-6-phosphate isomerase